MPKRSYNAPGGGPKKYQKKRHVTVASVNSKVNKIMRTQEKKAKDFGVKALNVTSSFYSPSGNVVNLIDIVQGDDIDSREGRRISVESFLLRYHIRYSEPTGGSGNALATIRTLVVWDKYPNGSLASGAEILDFSGIINGEEALAPMNLGNRDRFQVLFDDTNGLHKDAIRQNYGTGTLEESEVTCKTFVKVNKQSTWSDSTASVPTTGALLLVTVGNQWADASLQPQFRMTLVNRTRFIDS